MSILKYTAKYLLLGGLTLIVVVGIGTLVYNQLNKIKSESVVEGENPTAQAMDFQQSPIPVKISKSDKPPPLGETEDTGHWEGNVWRQKDAPKGDNKWLGGGDTQLYLLKLTTDSGAFPHGFKHARDFARWVIAEHPYSQAALEARLQLGGGETYLKDALKYHPTSPLLHAKIAADSYDAQDAVAFGKKALRLLQTTSEDYSAYRAYYSDPVTISHEALGIAYQRLGDYKSALVHLKAAKRLFEGGIGDDTLNQSGYELCSKWITAIESGNPIIKPDTKPQPPTSDFPMLSSETSSLVEQDVVNGPAAPVSELDFMLDMSDSVFFDRSDPSLAAADEAKRAKQAAEEARAAFIQKQQQARQRAKQEFDRFVRWMQTIENVKSPADLEDFLMHEMATHLQGGQSEFTPDRLIRAFETISPKTEKP